MILGMIAVASVAAISLLVSLNIIRERYYPIAIAVMSAGLVYAITLLGAYVVGSDAQGELAASRASLANGWDFFTATDANAITGINLTSIVTGMLAPGIARLFHIDLVWVYKAILPLFLTAVPVVMYYVFKSQTDSRRAFFASLFFVVMPVYSLQLAQLVKSMVGELFFALTILALVSPWKARYKGPAIAGFAILAAASHYTIGIALLAFLTGVLIFRLITARMKWQLWATRRTSVVTLALALAVSMGAFFTYYHFAYGGTVNQVLLGIARVHGNGTALYVEKAAEWMTPELTPPPSAANQTQTGAEVPKMSDRTDVPWIIPNRMYLYGQEYTVQVGIGLDFMSVPAAGKLFRIIQYLTQILIVIGAFRLLFRHRRYQFSAEFVAGVGCSFVLLVMCVFVPQFSSIINMPRFYQLSLFFLAPMLVLGCDAIAGGERRSEEQP